MWDFIAKNTNPVAISFVLIAALIFIVVLIYKKQIGALIDRISPQPVSAALQLQQQVSNPPQVAQAIMQIVPESIAAQKFYERVLVDFSAIDIEERCKLLAVWGANNFLRWDFESAKRIIFQSQLDALLNLRQKGPHPLAEYFESFQNRLKKHRELNPDVIEIDFEAWVGFLTNGHLFITVNGGVAAITERGDAFIQYLNTTPKANYGF